MHKGIFIYVRLKKPVCNTMLTDDVNLGQMTEVTAKGNDQDTTTKKMLIAIDESEHRGKIMRYGLTLAKSLGADVTVAHVIDRSSVTALGDLGGLLGYYQSGNRVYEQELAKHAKELLTEADAFAKNQGMQINIHVIMNASSVAEGIIDYASSTNVDLIVIGTKGKTGGQKFLVGGIANKIIDHAHCPVLAVR
jgi:nucleotide-binding universal stress UspA family protein